MQNLKDEILSTLEKFPIEWQEYVLKQMKDLLEMQSKDEEKQPEPLKEVIIEPVNEPKREIATLVARGGHSTTFEVTDEIIKMFENAKELDVSYLDAPQKDFSDL